MTRKEAISRIKEHMVIHENKEPRAIYITEALAMAIRALSAEPCEDAISREDILDAIETWDKFGVNAEQKLIRWQDHYVPYVHLDDVRNAIANMPSVTPKPKIGHWILYRDHKNMVDYPQCDNCGVIIKLPLPIDNLNYCPNCGCRMVENEVEE